MATAWLSSVMRHSSVSTQGTPRLIMISGAIATGKSTIAAALADLLRNQGKSVAVTDLDTVADMSARHDWDWAHNVHGSLVAAWLNTPIDVVIDEGTCNLAEVQTVLTRIPDSTIVQHVVLRADYQASLERAQNDPTRGISRNPEFLRRDHDRFADASTDLPRGLQLHVEGRSPADLADEIHRRLQQPSGTPEPI